MFTRTLKSATKLWPNLTVKSGVPGKTLRVLGIDPGLARMGWGVVERKGSAFQALAYGTLETKAGKPLPERLIDIFEGLQSLLMKYRPDVAAMEELFFSKNAKTAIVVGQARGVSLLACGLARVPVAEYRPMEIKQGVTGWAGADKGQVQKMVKMLLGLTEIPRPDDTADALAIAITHAQSAGTPLSDMVKRLSRKNAGIA
jgi:crossover junction endodeoxyribonuclease RuvC